MSESKQAEAFFLKTFFVEKAYFRFFCKISLFGKKGGPFFVQL